MFKGMILKTMESGRNDLRNYLEEHGVKLSTISEIGIEDFPSVEAFTCSGQGTTADISGFFASSYGKIYMEMGAQQIQPQGAPFALYTAFDQASGIFSVTAGIPVSSGGKTKGDVKLVKFREFKGLKGLHTGPYDEMNGSYQAVMDYAKENNIELTGVAWEFYLNNPAEISDPTLLQTQIVMEIKSK